MKGLRRAKKNVKETRGMATNQGDYKRETSRGESLKGEIQSRN